MRNQIPILRLQNAWRECERNIYHLCHALTLLTPILPITGERLEHLTDAQVQSVDQFILRFTKLQDAMGSRLFPALLQYLQEPYEERPMLDKLNRLEKLGYLQSAEDWQNIRNTRNKFAHDYPDDWEKNASLINVASEAAMNIYNILMEIDKKLAIDQPALALGKHLSVTPPDSHQFVSPSDA
jgi:hypothetical protein